MALHASLSCVSPLQGFLPSPKHPRGVSPLRALQVACSMCHALPRCHQRLLYPSFVAFPMGATRRRPFLHFGDPTPSFITPATRPRQVLKARLASVTRQPPFSMRVMRPRRSSLRCNPTLGFSTQATHPRRASGLYNPTPGFCTPSMCPQQSSRLYDPMRGFSMPARGPQRSYRLYDPTTALLCLSDVSSMLVPPV